MARYTKGYRSITKEEILNIAREDGLINANMVAEKLNKHFFTARKRLEELVDEGVLLKREYPRKIKTIRFYEIIESEDEIAGKSFE